MARSERDIFNDHVAVLVRQLGIDLEDLSEAQRQRLLDHARQHRLNDHEAALAVAYRHVPDLLDDDFERARVLIDRLELIAREWRDDELVSRTSIAPFQRDARERLQRAQP